MKTKPIVAYFSAEYAICDDMPIYAGGLGILAADLILEAGQEDRELYGIGLVYHQSFAGDDPDQRPMTERLIANGFSLAMRDGGELLTAGVQIADREVILQAWVKRWGKTALILLDSHLADNDERDQAICNHLYPSDAGIAFSQEICLGFGGLAMLESMRVTPEVYHLNEGHTALAGLALALRQHDMHHGKTFAEALDAVKPRIVGTKHTILPGAGLFMDWGNVEILLGPTLLQSGASINDLKSVAMQSDGDYSDTRLLISVAGVCTGVSALHVQQEKREHPESRLVAVTNGVYEPRWLANGWGERPLALTDLNLWGIHCENRRQLLEHVRAESGVALDPNRLTVVWARRMTAYKRPALLVNDLDRLAKLMHHSSRPIQFIVAGEANPTDVEGNELMNRVIEAARQPNLADFVAHLPRYNTVDAKWLVRGADVWLNTPVRGFEACGTSGMKASLNGAVQFSTADGWTAEVDLDGIGWQLPDRAEHAIYDLLEDEIAPLFYKRGKDGLPAGWIRKMRANMTLASKEFTAKRMLSDYDKILYAPAALRTV